jgi:hypothetical protein
MYQTESGGQDCPSYTRGANNIVSATPTAVQK